MREQLQKKYYPVIDIVRFAAAFSVMAFHLTFAVWALPESSRGGILPVSVRFPEVAEVTWWGWVGVQVFFVISGAVIANSAYGNSAATFIKSRVLRLYPAVWICATITAGILLYWGMYPTLDLTNRYVRSVTLFPLYPWVDGVYWTLAVEIVFYALVAVLLGFGLFQKVEVLAVCMATITIVAQIAFYFDIGGDLPRQVIRLSMMEYGSYFALGIAIWSFFVRGKKIDRFLILCYCVGGCILQLRNFTHELLATVEAVRGAVSWLVPTAVWCVAASTICIGYAFPFQSRSRVLAVTRTLGLMTYPLYLLHFTCGVFIMSEASKIGAGRTPALCIAISSVLILSWLVASFFEPYVRSVVFQPVSSVIAWGERRMEAAVISARRGK